MRASTVFLTLLLMTIIFSAILLQTTISTRAQSSSIPISQEYVSGDLNVGQYQNLLAWFTWVNINETHTIFLALHANQLPSPVFSFVGQAYNTTAGSRIFVGNALLSMEVYNDTDGNGYLDANYNIPATELRYTLIMNASNTFTPYPVNKTNINGTPHYRWGITYGSVQAILVNATPPYYGYGGGTYASYATIEHVSMFYDFSVVGNTTFLKTSYQIGAVTLQYPNPGVTLQGLSLSLLHATLTVASKPLAVVAGSSPYNSQSNAAASPFNAAQVNVNNVVAYEFRFKDNYTLLSSPPKSYPAVYLASPINSIPLNAFQGNYFTPLIRVQNYVQGQLPDIAGLPASSNINYSDSQFLYRISYPKWDGQALQHDPTYVAHLSPLSPHGPSPIPLPMGLPTLVIFASATGLLALVVAINGLRRLRRSAQPTSELQSPEGNSGSQA